MAEKETNQEAGNEPRQEEQPQGFPDVPDDFYERLGVSPDASADEINSAWRKKIGGFHPDRYTDSKQKKAAEEWSKNLNEARQTLGGDEEKRKKYDEKRKKRIEEEQRKEEAARVEKEKEQAEQERKTAASRDAAFAAAASADSRKQSGNSPMGRGNERQGPDQTIYDLAAAKKDHIGWFVFVEGHKVYINDEQKKDKGGKPIGPPPGAPINAFWRQQTELMTPSEKAYEHLPVGLAETRENIKGFARSLFGLNGNPEKEKEVMEEYESLVRSGKAKFMGELAVIKEAPVNHPQKNLPDMRLYKVMKKRYAKAGSFDTHEFKLVGVYDERGRFTGKARLYRIEKAA